LLLAVTCVVAASNIARAVLIFSQDIHCVLHAGIVSGDAMKPVTPGCLHLVTSQVDDLPPSVSLTFTQRLKANTSFSSYAFSSKPTRFSAHEPPNFSSITDKEYYPYFIRVHLLDKTVSNKKFPSALSQKNLQHRFLRVLVSDLEIKRGSYFGSSSR